MLELTEVLFLNVEEAARLLENGAERDLHILTKGLLAMGPKIVVITDGQNGAHATDGQKCWFMPIQAQAPIVERTGAGDSFASGFLSALLHGEAVPEALRWGTLNAASVIGQVGPQAGLLHLKEMKKDLKTYKQLSTEAC